MRFFLLFFCCVIQKKLRHNRNFRILLYLIFFCSHKSISLSVFVRMSLVPKEVLNRIAATYIRSAHPESNTHTILPKTLFCSYFGLSVQVVADLWREIHPIIVEKGFRPHLKPHHLLWALFYLKCYRTWNHSADFVGVACNTYKFYVMKVLEVLFDLSAREVSYVDSVICSSFAFNLTRHASLF